MIGYYTYLCCHLPFIFKDELISAETVNVITIQEKPHLKAITAKMAMKMQRTGERTYSGSISKVPNLYLDAEKVLHDSSQLFYNHFGTNFLMPFFKTFHCAFISLKKPCTCFGSNNSFIMQYCWNQKFYFVVVHTIIKYCNTKLLIWPQLHHSLNRRFVKVIPDDRNLGVKQTWTYSDIKLLNSVCISFKWCLHWNMVYTWSLFCMHAIVCKIVASTLLKMLSLSKMCCWVFKVNIISCPNQIDHSQLLLICRSEFCLCLPYFLYSTEKNTVRTHSVTSNTLMYSLAYSHLLLSF